MKITPPIMWYFWTLTATLEDVNKVLDALHEDVDVVSGSRFHSGGGKPVA